MKYIKLFIVVSVIFLWSCAHHKEEPIQINKELQNKYFPESKNPEWAINLPMQTGSNFVIGVNEGMQLTSTGKSLAAVLLARLESSYVVRYEAYKSLMHEQMPKAENMRFAVVIAERADLIAKKHLPSLNKISEFNDQSIHFTLFSSPDSVGNFTEILSKNSPNLKSAQVIEKKGVVYSRFATTSADPSDAVDRAFKEALTLLGQNIAMSFEGVLTWTQREVSNRKTADFGEEFTVMESRAILRNVKINKLTIKHVVKQNLHYYKADVILSREI